MNDTPQRIQLRRTKGWRKAEDAIVVARPTRWSNPFSVEKYGRAEAVRMYHAWVLKNRKVEEIQQELAGHDLACWCPLDKPCHADILLELANP